MARKQDGIAPGATSKPVFENVKSADTAKPKHGQRFTETIVTHNFPNLLPFGNTIMRIRGNRFTIRCGSYALAGYDGTVDSIVKAFVEHVSQEMTAVKWEVESDAFKTGENLRDDGPVEVVN